MTRAGPSRAASRLRPPEARWLLPDAPDERVVRTLMTELGLPRAVCAVLAVRGLAAEDDAKAFLRPRLEGLLDPAALADGLRAAERIARAIDAGETILVHGDYDVDGICATALYTRWLRRLGGRVAPFVPHRLRDGYDFGPAGLEAARAAGAGVVLTADCGTVAHDAVEAARAEGIDVVVSDHHTVQGALPPAFAVVNPHRPDCPYPEKGLCGAGIALKVCALVAGASGVDASELNGFLDLVALATVADLVPLTGENRTLVHYGLRRFPVTRVPGVAALLEVAGVDPSAVTSGQLGFVVAPRINAAGRIGESEEALRLLLTDDPAEARRLAERLDRINQERREEDRRILDEALAMLEGSYDPERDFGLVLASEGWHPGVIGIVASRVVEHVHRPVVLVALDGERGRGSARSVPGFDLYGALSECSEHMLRFGGHRQAAGMDVARERIDDLREAFNAVARARLDADTLRPGLRADLELGPAEADLELARWLGYLGPHGIGNPGPVFLARGVRLERARIVGENHLKAVLTADGGRLDAIGFGLADLHPPDAVQAEPHDVLYKLERNEYRGVARPQARVVALRRTDPAP